MSPRSIIAAAVVLLALPATAAAKLPFLAASPSVGGKATVFTVVVPKRIVDELDENADVVVDLEHRRKRCTPDVYGFAQLRKNGTAVVRMKPKLLRADAGKRWCSGTYRVSIESQVILPDSDDGGGGTDTTKIARSRFSVR